jgi:hypothetical protein
MDSILGDLESMGCSARKLNNIEKTLTEYPYNNGLTYSNIVYR